MLRSFDYVEYSEDNVSIQDKSSFNEELKIAYNYISNYNGKKGNGVPPICVCSNETQMFFKKWGISYYRCPVCGAVMADVTSDEVKYFKNCQELNEFRTSATYQDSASIKREQDWEELLDWIRFRTFRYLKLKTVSIADYGNRYLGLINTLKESPFVTHYYLTESILSKQVDNLSEVEPCDITLYFNNLQSSLTPIDDIKKTRTTLKDCGLLFFSTRIGTGFDMLCLLEHSKIFPYEHIYLPSIDTLKIILEKAGYKILEIATPGRLDAIYVREQRERICSGDYFIKYLMDHADMTILQEFQRFLQQCNMSSYVQIVAQKVEEPK